MIRDDINKFSKEDDKPVLLWLLSRYHYTSQWQFVADCSHVRHGKLSYQTNIVWRPTQEGYVLYNHKEELQ